MDEHRMIDNGDVVPMVEGPDGRPLADADVASGYPTRARMAATQPAAEFNDYLASVQAEREQYKRVGNAAGVAACDEEIAATRARMNNGTDKR